MGNFIGIHVIKNYNPGLFNRDMNNEAKQVRVGSVNRSRISPYALKRVLREEMEVDELRAAHLEDFIEKLLMNCVKDETLTQEEADKIGEFICSKDVLGSDSWKKRASVAAKKESDTKQTKKESDSDSTKENADKKGRQIIVTNDMELMAIYDSIMKAKADGCLFDKNGNIDKKATVKTIKAALDNVDVSIAKALFGTFPNSGVIETVDGAVQMAHAFSIDEYRPEVDDFVGKFSSHFKEKADPFYAALSDFSANESNKTAADAMGSSDVYSNTMYLYSNINIRELLRNLRTCASGKMSTERDAAVMNVISSQVPLYIEKFINGMPAAKQHSGSSHCDAAIALIECIENGNNSQPDFNRVIKYDRDRDVGVAEQGIEVIHRWASDDTFRTGNVRRYVMLGAEYKKYTQDFEENGIVIIHNPNELCDIMRKESVKLAID